MYDNYIHFIDSFGLMSILSILYGVVYRSNINKTVSDIVLGCLFGIGAIIAMTRPIPITEGVFVDARFLFIGFSGAFLGPVGAIVSMCLASTARWILGGTGAYVGIISIITTTLFGFLWSYYIREKYKNKYIKYISLGCAISSGLACALLFPSQVSSDIFKHAGILIVASDILSALTLGAFIEREQFNAKKERRLALEAKTDTLTGLLNRRSLHQAYADANTYKGYRGTAVLVVDIDHFKLINDTFGHDGGDVALRTVSDILNSAVRQGDLVARLGGEEFAVVLMNNTIATALDIAERLRSTIENNEITYFDKNIKMTASIGIYWNKNHEELDSMLSVADKALYTAKNQGRNKVVVSSIKAA